MSLYLARYQTEIGPRWALDSRLLPEGFTLGHLLGMSGDAVLEHLRTLSTSQTVDSKAPLLPPLEPSHEVWASGVTYLRSREARKAESQTADVYDKVYQAARPELFFKTIGWRAAGDKMPIRVREDSHWNTPEPELVLVLNQGMEIVGYCAGNDVSSRAIEGENPLYLPQAKVYQGSCALGPGIVLFGAEGVEALRDLPIALSIVRQGAAVFEGTTRTSQMKRSLEELAHYLGKELPFPQGAFLMTGTGIVPPEAFSLQVGDLVTIGVGHLTLTNEVQP